MSKQIARTSYLIGSVNVPAILVNDRDMHNLDALWRAWGKPKDREPLSYIRSADGKRYQEAVAGRFRVDPSHLTYFNGEGWWATQLIAVDYARWISKDFAVMVDALATTAAKRLQNKSDALFQEVRHNGKIAHAEASSVRDQFKPLLVKGKDLKHPFANAAVCEAITGKKPGELRTEMCISKKDSIWDVLPAEQNALRLVALVYERPKLEAVLPNTTDPNVMLRIVRENARKVSEAGKQLESDS